MTACQNFTTFDKAKIVPKGSNSYVVANNFILDGEFNINRLSMNRNVQHLYNMLSGGVPPTASPERALSDRIAALLSIR